MFRVGDENRPSDTAPPECCNPSCPNHEQCFPIHIPPDDPFFSQFNITCMEFTRSVPVLRHNCRFGVREQVNQVTHFLDASNIYGSDSQQESTLRAHLDGMLRWNADRNLVQHGIELLPPVWFTGDECEAKKGEACFFAGDERVNEQPMLTIFHTIFLREHNRIARRLKEGAQEVSP